MMNLEKKSLESKLGVLDVTQNSEIQQKDKEII